jgi:hypothetical protein
VVHFFVIMVHWADNAPLVPDPSGAFSCADAGKMIASARKYG